MEDFGWGGDHVGKLHSLQVAVAALAEGSGKTAERLEKATFPLIRLTPADFPEKLRKRAKNVLTLRTRYVFHAGDYSSFHRVPPNEKKRFVRDLLALYEGCLIDMGRGWPTWDFMYPKEEEDPSRKRRRR